MCGPKCIDDPPGQTTAPIHCWRKTSVELKQKCAARLEDAQHLADILKDERLRRKVLQHQIAEDEVCRACLDARQIGAVAEEPQDVVLAWMNPPRPLQHFRGHIESIDALESAGKTPRHAPGAAAQFDHHLPAYGDLRAFER